jgi:hypothetical protein
MTQDEALMYLVASRDNPYVAAWLAVLDVNKLPVCTPIAPHDWWDSFQAVYLHGLVSDEHFATIDIAKTFFGVKQPSSAELSDATHQLKHLRQLAKPEENRPMSNPKSIAIFEKEERALAKPNGHGALDSPSGLFNPLAPAHRPGEMQIFEDPPAPTLSHRRSPVKAFEETRAVIADRANKGLACVDPAPYVENVDFVMMCCGQPIDIVLDDGDMIDPGAEEHSNVLEEMIFHGSCPTCEAEYHTSMSRPVPRDRLGG